MSNSRRRLVLSTIVAIVASGSAPFSGTAIAGTLPDGNGGAVCKGSGSCLLLSIECKDTYTDATQKDGTAYGKCSKTAQITLDLVGTTLPVNATRPGGAR